jgi:hypothetical protein
VLAAVVNISVWFIIFIPLKLYELGNLADMGCVQNNVASILPYRL